MGTQAVDHVAPSDSGYYDRAVSVALRRRRRARSLVRTVESKINACLDRDHVQRGSGRRALLIASWPLCEGVMESVGGHPLAASRKPPAYVQGSAGNRSFWVGSVNPEDPNPIPGLGGTPDQIEKFNLVDGSRAVWFYQAGSGVSFVGQDLAGHPIVSTYGESGQPTQLLLVPSPGTRRSIETTFGTLPSLGGPIADSHGVWFGSTDGIYLYSDAGGLQKVSSQPGYPGNGCF